MARTRANLSHKRGVKPPSRLPPRSVLNGPTGDQDPSANCPGCNPPARTRADLSHKRGVKPPSRLPPRSVLNGPHRGPGPQARIARGATPPHKKNLSFPAQTANPPARTRANLSHKRGVKPPSRLPPRSVLNGPHRGPGPQARIAGVHPPAQEKLAFSSTNRQSPGADAR